MGVDGTARVERGASDRGGDGGVVSGRRASGLEWGGVEAAVGEERFVAEVEVSDAGDAIHDEERHHDFTRRVKLRRVIREVGVDVHVPETWDHEHARAVEGGSGSGLVARVVDSRDAISFDDDALMLLQSTVRDIDDRDVVDRDCLRFDLGG